MPSIDTLVDDINNLISNPHLFNQDNVAKFSLHLANRLSYRLSENRGAGTLRMSNLGRPCDRQLWYDVHSHADREDLPPAARFKYLYGDNLEELLLFLARESGHVVEREQAEVSLDGVIGHIDAIIDGRLIDVKSASSFAFAKFKDHSLPADDPFGYLDQLGCYLHSCSFPELKEKDVASFLVVDKNQGHIVLDTYVFDTTKDYSSIISAKRAALASADPPSRYFTDKPFQKSGNRALGVECGYCPFKSKCWADANDGQGLKTAFYSNKPVFLTKVVREPRVKAEF
jgi:hypothetical protein